MFSTKQYLYPDYPIQSIASIPNPNPNPNPYPFSYPHSTHHLTTTYEFDPYGNVSSYRRIEIDPVAQNGIYRDPFVGFGNGDWLVGESQPSGAVQYYDSCRSLSMEAPASSNYVKKRNQFNQGFGKSSTSKIYTAMARSPSVRCELCNIDCPNIDIYTGHLLGKKHNKNLEAKYAPTDGQIQQASKRIDVRMTTLVGSNGADEAAVDHGETLKRKSHKLVEGGASIDSVKICTVCNVVCNSEIVFADHLSGKKHAIQVAAIASHPATVDAYKIYPLEAKNSQTARCEIININCKNAEALNSNKLGKKHQKNVTKRRNLIRKDNNNQEISEKPKNSEIVTTASDSTMPINEVKKDTQPSNVKDTKLMRLKKRLLKIDTSEDLETKRRKVVQGGVPEEAIRTCYVCNVVCNSEKVFSSHLAGQRHAAVVRQKQGESGVQAK
ncbi:hypothetical protein Droror1_Dr00021135 [Drosera rotundifolia]